MDKTKEFYHRRKSYYTSCKILLYIIGQWPYQSSLTSMISIIIAVTLGTSIIIPQSVACYELRANISDVLECLSPILVDVTCFINLLNLLINNRKLKELLTDLAEDWENLKTKEELHILHNYTKTGTLISNSYIRDLSLWNYDHLHITSTIFHKYAKNSTWNKSNYCIFFHCVISITPEILLITFIQHACGMFKIVCYQLENVLEDGNLDIDLHLQTTNDAVYKKLSNLIKKHNRAMQFSQQIESLFSITLFFALGILVIMMIITAVQALLFSDVLDELARSIEFASVQLLHVFFKCWLAQRLMDAAYRIRYYTYKSRWYRMSLKSRKLLILMMIRTNIPCNITAGKLVTFSFVTFSARQIDSQIFAFLISTSSNPYISIVHHNLSVYDNGVRLRVELKLNKYTIVFSKTPYYSQTFFIYDYFSKIVYLIGISDFGGKIK
ncbi:odorant receptor 46a-like [Prorops nasuta]|uniref:odorant receptor 46a-like n=1 Tax=Prorops nasuta TaxID=863751 RepID=UPI0034CF797A